MSKAYDTARAYVELKELYASVRANGGAYIETHNVRAGDLVSAYGRYYEVERVDQTGVYARLIGAKPNEDEVELAGDCVTRYPRHIVDVLLYLRRQMDGIEQSWDGRRPLEYYIQRLKDRELADVVMPKYRPMMGTTIWGKPFKLKLVSLNLYRLIAYIEIDGRETIREIEWCKAAAFTLAIAGDAYNMISWSPCSRLFSPQAGDTILKLRRPNELGGIP
jgi:hypothetical protein